MPKSKRDKKISLTQTKKKGLAWKQQLVEEISKCCHTFKTIYLFSVQNMRNTSFKAIREEWKDSRFFFGKNKVMMRALASQGKKGGALQLKGQMGLLFTNRKQDTVLNFFENYSELDYARAGNTATQTVVLSAGPIEGFCHSIEPQLRKLGLPTCLKRGVVTLETDYRVCSEGDVLNVNQARILKLFGHKMAEFRVAMEQWRDSAGKWHTLDVPASHKSSLPSSVTVTAKITEPMEQENDEDDDEEEDDEDEDI